MIWQLTLYFSGGPEGVDAVAEKIEYFTRRLGSLDPRLAAWAFVDPDDNAHPVEGVAAWRAALAQCHAPFQSGARSVDAWQPRAVVLGRGANLVEIEATLGIRLPDFEGLVWVPNRVVVRVLRPWGDDETIRATLDLALRVGIRAFEPVWAHAGSDDSPHAAMPIFDDGSPIVGWWTYLSRQFPAVAPLAAPAQAFAVGEHGTLIVAHPALYAPGDAEHEAAIEAVGDALDAQGLLKPAGSFRREAAT
ncbi:MAG: immunity 52 family protein [Myxococcales bacterium]|nr:immunity 52 family protein [Myxococcales bacterium]